MISKYFLGVFVLLLSWSAIAQKPAITPVAAPTLKQEPVPRTVHAMLAYGSELRPEKNIDGDYEEHVLTNYALGVGYRQYIFILEKAEFKESSGNTTLNLERTLQDYLLWGQYRALTWNHLAPFMGLGLGTYKETIKTNFMGSSRTDESANKFLGGLSFGVSLDVPVLWFSLEARFLFGDELERQPTLGGLARVGIQF